MHQTNRGISGHTTNERRRSFIREARDGTPKNIRKPSHLIQRTSSFLFDKLSNFRSPSRDTSRVESTANKVFQGTRSLGSFDRADQNEIVSIDLLQRSYSSALEHPHTVPEPSFVHEVLFHSIGNDRDVANILHSITEDNNLMASALSHGCSFVGSR